MLYSYKNQYPTILPERIRLSDGSTRTDSSTFTEEELIDAGYMKVESSPAYNSDTENIIWNGESWEVVSLTQAEIEEKQKLLWEEVRNTRDLKIKEVEWRVFRYQSEVRLGLDPTDDIQQIDEYIQRLRDITKQEDPYSISWPSIP